MLALSEGGVRCDYSVSLAPYALVGLADRLVEEIENAEINDDSSLSADSESDSSSQTAGPSQASDSSLTDSSSADLAEVSDSTAESTVQSGIQDDSSSSADGIQNYDEN